MNHSDKPSGVRMGARVFWRDDDGAIALEFALIAPVLLLLLVASTDLGLAIYANMRLRSAANAATAYAALHGPDIAGIKAAAEGATTLKITTTPSSYSGCATPSGVVQTPSASKCNSGRDAGTYVSTTITATYKPLFPFAWQALDMSVTRVTRTK